ncbi:MAG: hypothetical protein ACTS8P_06400, partial [Arsenophonus sp. NC-XBC3-MAG3]
LNRIKNDLDEISVVESFPNKIEGMKQKTKLTYTCVITGRMFLDRDFEKKMAIDREENPKIGTT